jgi:hypothetical protein
LLTGLVIGVIVALLALVGTRLANSSRDWEDD